MSSVYSLGQFGAMIVDRVRMDAYIGALTAAITPGAVVLDIGSGPGTTAMLCVRLGAGHVYALDPDPSIRLARLAAERNGMGDQITVIEGISQDFQPPAPVDVVVSDLRDRLPLNGFHIPSIVDARTRLLKPGGAQIPHRDTLYAAPVTYPDAYDRVVGPWRTDVYDLDMTDVIDRVVNRHEMYRAGPEHLAAPAQAWATIDYHTVTDPTVRGTVEWTIEDRRTIHGLEMWFDAEVADGFSYSNAPDASNLVYGTEFFPFHRALDVEPGDTLKCVIGAHWLKGVYTWRWRTELHRNGKKIIGFDQSDLKGDLQDPRPVLLRQQPAHVPTLSPEARALHVVLAAFVEGATVAEATAALAAAGIPGHADEQAIDFVASASARYSTAMPGD
ncbi:MAG: protein arginine N-methyltransferase 1 [Candidatus Aldehydirespiratoraceae bacterium]|jgi:protein arginine N-methyltransferase 1